MKAVEKIRSVLGFVKKKNLDALQILQYVKTKNFFFFFISRRRFNVNPFLTLAVCVTLIML